MTPTILTTARRLRLDADRFRLTADELHVEGEINMHEACELAKAADRIVVYRNANWNERECRMPRMGGAIGGGAEGRRATR